MTVEPGRPWPLRAPCGHCGHTAGVLREVNGQDTVRCARCDTFGYNAPRAETGRPVRRIKTRPDLKPAERADIVARDGGRCVAEGATQGPCDGPLHVGHLISVHDGRAHGIPDAWLEHPANKALMCAAHNFGLGRDSVTIAMLYRVLLFAGDGGEDDPIGLFRDCIAHWRLAFDSQGEIGP